MTALRFSPMGRAVSALLLGFLLLGGALFAQEVTGSIRGSVVDPSGSAVPNARVEVTSGQLATPIIVNTDASGLFLVPQLAPGTYNLSASAAGFATTRKNEVPVAIGRSTRVEFRLEVGQVSESVVVAADAVMVDTTSSASAVNVDRTFFDILPKGRSFYDLAAIAPGVRPEGKSGGMQVDGASGSENTFYIDGMEVTNIQTGVLSDKNRIPIEMVQQTQIKNGVMEAQYGGAMGGVISAVVRSGTNDFHGMAGFYFNNDEMQGRPRDSLQTLDPNDETRAAYFRNPADNFTTWNPVVNLAGPILRNKLFFFTGYAPVHTNTDRSIKFNVDGKVRDFSQKSVTHFLTNKLDYMPFTKLRLAGSWTWNPNYVQGVLPSRQGTDDPNNNWGAQGNYDAGQIFAYSADFVPTSKLAGC